MEIKKIIFEEEPKRLDVFLTAEKKLLSREFVKKLICEGGALVNGKPKKPAYILHKGDEITFAARAVCSCGAAEPGLDVLFEDKDIIVISKPAGLSVHPNDSNWERDPEALASGSPTVVSLLYKARPGTAGAGLSRLGLVHRLDRDTSGIMVLAKTQKAQDSLLAQFRERAVEKTYVGVVDGKPEKRRGAIEAPIGRVTGSKRIKVWEYGRYSLTEYEVSEQAKNHALVQIHPRTGRTNQIRVHFAHIGFPISGDRLYGGGPAARLMLHSLKISFTHPSTGKKVSFGAALPDDFKLEWEKLRE